MDISIKLNVDVKFSIPQNIISRSAIGRKYGWRPPTPNDLKRYSFLHPLKTFKLKADASPLPEKVDLRKNMPPIYEQRSIGSCHDDQTEILTESGWKLFKDVLEGEKLATVNPKTAELIYEKPVRLIKLEYKGELVVGKHTFIDFRVTPDHKMLLRKWNQKKRMLNEDYEFVDAKNIGWYCGLMNRVVWKGDDKASDYYTLPGVEHKLKIQREDKIIPMGVWLKFLGIYLAEGCFGARGTYRIQLAAFKEKEKTFIKELLNEMGQTYTEYIDRFVINNKQIHTELIRLGLERVRSPYKFVPEFVFHQKAEHIQEFLRGHFEGDGCFSTFKHKSHYTSSEKLADDLQLLIFLSGNQSGIYKRPPRTSTMKDGRVVKGRFPECRVSVSENINSSIDRKDNITSEWYEGYVYCAEVPTYHTLVTRRNNKILISGNCVSQSLAAIFEYNQIKKKDICAFRPSRLFIYYFGRLKAGTVMEDSGMMIYDGIGALTLVGVCPEEVPAWNAHNISKEVCWAYDTDRFKEKPPVRSILFARNHKASLAKRVEQSLFQLKSALAKGYPIAFGMILYESFEAEELRKTGVMKIPDSEKEGIIGGHAMCIVGYDNDKTFSSAGEGGFLVRNSWGEDWGEEGYFWAPYSVITNGSLCLDFWIFKDNSHQY